MQFSLNCTLRFISTAAVVAHVIFSHALLTKSGEICSTTWLVQLVSTSCQQINDAQITIACGNIPDYQ